MLAIAGEASLLQKYHENFKKTTREDERGSRAVIGHRNARGFWTTVDGKPNA